MLTVRGCTFPTDRFYDAQCNVWLKPDGRGNVVLGATAFGVALAGEFIEFVPKPAGTRVDAGRAVGLLVHQTIVWVKSRPVLTRSDYMWQHEPAFYGWPDDPDAERLHDDWTLETDPAKQRKLEIAYELQAYKTLPYIPLGHYIQSSAWRENITGILKGPSVVFWNVKKG